MNKKNVGLGAFLGFWVLGIFYSAGFSRKGFGAFIGLCVVSWALANFVSPAVSVVVNAIGAYLGYTWTKEHNAEVESGGNITTGGTVG
ncbi:MAG: phospho-N-acetylmuramoyl-pentapeptide-transferase [Selenomonadaceae bacterium]|nr:phospho-N-acetylmuramoyl-pentapeptide-transferase [Selenomonadaceae bacterium]